MTDEHKNTCVDCTQMSDCFRVLSKEELELVGQKMVRLSFRKGEIIAKQGAFATHIMFVKSGLVKLYRESENDQNDLIINIYAADNILGLSSLFGDSIFHYSVAALEDSSLCLIEINIVRELVGRNSDFSVSVIKRLSRNNLLAYEILYAVTHKQLNGRMASAMIYLAREVFQSSGFTMPLSRKELAEFTGMSVMSAVRAMKDLRQNGLIGSENGRIEILDMERLEQISKFG